MYEHLSDEYRTLKATITDLEQMISESKDKVMRMATRMNLLDAQGHFVKKIKAEIDKCYARATERTSVEELEWQLVREKELEERVALQAQEAEIEERARLAAAPKSDDDASDLLLNMTRLKPSVRRSAEEKAWIALDALLNPEYYDKHVSEQEHEEMKYGKLVID